MTEDRPTSSPRLRFRKFIYSASRRFNRLSTAPIYYSTGAYYCLLKGFAAYHGAEDRLLHRNTGGDAHVAAVVPQRHTPQMLGVLIETRGIQGARIGIERQLQMLAGFGVFEIQLAVPGRLTILVGPHLHQQQLVPEISQILKGTLDVGIVEKIRDD